MVHWLSLQERPVPFLQRELQLHSGSLRPQPEPEWSHWWF